MARRTTAAAATVTPLRAAGDSTGISPSASTAEGMVMVPLGALAAHPRNPRGDLGDLAELTASIKAQGLFEPLVTLSVAAYTAAAEVDGDPEHPADGITHVIVMGHRRAEACRAAGLANVPVIVRDDLAGNGALAAMIAENMHREDLTPLAEAEAFAELARRGWRQRRIAAETGCSQAHVSKRLTLLQLPSTARDALAAGTITVADGLELHKLYGSGHDAAAEAVIGEAVDSITQGYSADTAIRHARAGLDRARAEQATRDKLAAEGIQVVTDQQRARLGWPRLYGTTTRHAKAGCLAALIGWSGEAEYVCINPAGHPGTAENKEARRDAERRETERESRRAAKARDVACQQIAAGPMPTARDLTQLLATTVLTGSGGGYSEALRLAWRWLRDSGAVQADGDHYAARAEVTVAGDRAALLRYARAYALADDELHVRSRGYGAPGWGERHTAHIDLLTRAAGYQPTAWEARQLADADACQQARGALSCPACGCAACEISYDRDQDKPVLECGWSCGQHRAHRELGLLAVTGAGGEPGAGPEDAAVN